MLRRAASGAPLATDQTQGVVCECAEVGPDLRPSASCGSRQPIRSCHLPDRYPDRLSPRFPEIVIDIVVSNAMLNLSKRDADVAIRASYQQPDTPAGTLCFAHWLGGVRREGMVEHILDRALI